MRIAKRNIGSLVVIIATCILSYSATAQDYKADMQKIRTTYKSKYHSFSIKYLYYPYDSIKKVTDSIKGTCIVDSQYWYYKMRSSAGLVEYMKNEKYFIEVNYANKVIIISKNSNVKRDLWDINKVDSLLRLPAVKVNYQEKGSEGEYIVAFDEGSWNKMKLVFNKDRHTLDEIWLYSSAKGKILGEPYKNPIIAILYTSYSESPPTKSDFNEGKYVQEIQNGNFQAVGVFKEFKLLDYVHKRT